MSDSDINELLPYDKMSERIKFRYYLNIWRKSRLDQDTAGSVASGSTLIDINTVSAPTTPFISNSETQSTEDVRVFKSLIL